MKKVIFLVTLALTLLGCAGRPELKQVTSGDEKPINTPAMAEKLKQSHAK